MESWLLAPGGRGCRKRSVVKTRDPLTLCRLPQGPKHEPSRVPGRCGLPNSSRARGGFTSPASRRADSRRASVPRGKASLSTLANRVAPAPHHPFGGLLRRSVGPSAMASFHMEVGCIRLNVFILFSGHACQFSKLLPLGAGPQVPRIHSGLQSVSLSFIV